MFAMPVTLASVSGKKCKLSGDFSNHKVNIDEENKHLN